MQGIDRGFAVIRSLGSARSGRTIAQVAELTGLTRAVARRYLFTLLKLGYVMQRGAEFALAPRIAHLGYAYLSTVKLVAVAPPFMEALVAKIHESCSMSVLDGSDVVYIARVAAGRLMTINLVVGSRLPAHATSMGKVLLAQLPPSQFNRYLANHPLPSSAGRTSRDAAAFKAEIRRVREQGWAITDGQLEEGIRSIAVPVFDGLGQIAAALNISAHATRVSLQDLRRIHLPRLQQTAAAISAAVRAAQ